MLTTSKISTAKYRFFFVTNLVIISELISHYLKGHELFSDSWLYSAFSFLFAYIFYMIFLEDFIIKFTYTPRINQPTIDLLRLTSLFVVSKIFTNYLESGIVNINSKWIIKTLMITGSYFITDITLSDYLIKFNNHQLLFYNITKMFLSEYLIVLFLYNQFTITDFIDNISFLISYIFFETITKKFIN
jgi:hypothetical protein